MALSIVILGGDSDIATKRVIPAFFRLYCTGLLPDTLLLCGYGSAELSTAEFRTSLKLGAGNRAAFLERCEYRRGEYSAAGIESSLSGFLAEREGGGAADRLFYFAVSSEDEVGALARAVRASGLRLDRSPAPRSSASTTTMFGRGRASRAAVESGDASHPAKIVAAARRARHRGRGADMPRRYRTGTRSPTVPFSSPPNHRNR